MHIDYALAHAIESGPAAGVIATAALAGRIGLILQGFPLPIGNAISIDMGGTTARRPGPR